MKYSSALESPEQVELTVSPYRDNADMTSTARGHFWWASLSPKEKLIFQASVAFAIVSLVMGTVSVKATNTYTYKELHNFEGTDASFVFNGGLYVLIAFVGIGMSASFMIMCYIVLCPHFRIAAIPFAGSIFFAHFMHWLFRYVQLAFAVSYQHWHLCKYIGALSYGFEYASTVWIAVSAVDLCVTVRWAPGERYRPMRNLASHLAGWMWPLISTTTMAYPYVTGHKEMSTSISTFCCMGKSEQFMYLIPTTVSIAVNVAVVVILHRCIDAIYPNAAKARIQKISNRLLLSFLISRFPKYVKVLWNANTVDLISIPAYVLYIIGEFMYMIFVLTDAYQRRMDGEAVLSLSMIDARKITFEPNQIPIATAEHCIYQAEWKKREVAVRLFDRQQENEQTYDEIKQEAMFVSKFEHPNILKTYGLTLFDERLAVITEYMKGSSVLQVVVEDMNIQISYMQTLRWCLDVARALHYLHTCSPGIVYRKLCPRSCIVQSDNTLKLVDFTLARSIGAGGSRTTMSTAASTQMSLWLLQQTSYCLAPELLVRGESYDYGADSFSIGMFCWLLCTRSAQPYGERKGITLLDGIVNHDLRPQIPDYVPLAMKSLISMCWHPDSRSRPEMPIIIKILKAEYAKRRVFLCIDNRVRETER